ncbi:MAG: CBS domain-containing protein [Deltaproteobacteria bacterium]|nr:CBS domain-containing protein [Deltaproteobacteria bacterium]
MVTLDTVMHQPIVAVAPRTTAGEARKLAQHRHVRHLLVVDKADLVGVVCVCDLRDADWSEPVEERMRFPVMTIDKQASVHDAAAILREQTIGCVPVIADDSVVGVVSRGDLLRAGLPPDEVLGTHVCAACGRYHDVHPYRLGPDVQFCEECLDRATPASDDDEVGGGD